MEEGANSEKSLRFETAAQMKLIEKEHQNKQQSQYFKKTDLKNDLLKAYLLQKDKHKSPEHSSTQETQETPQETPQEIHLFSSPPSEEPLKTAFFPDNTDLVGYAQIHKKKVRVPVETQRETPDSSFVSEKSCDKTKDTAEETKKPKYTRHKNLPKVQYKRPSNVKLIKNAISQVCLAGYPNKNQCETILKLIDSLDATYLIIVFKSELGRRDLGALYSFNTLTNEVHKVHGHSKYPSSLTANLVKVFFRYDSGAKEFKTLQCKDFIIGCDAVVLKKL